MKESPFARFLDRYLGVLACYILSLVHSFIKFFSKKKEPKKIEKILLIEMFEMGAAVMLIPSINYLKRKHPQAEIYCLTTSNCSILWENIKIIPSKNVIVISAKNPFLFLINLVQTVLKLWSKKFDLIIDYELFMRVPALICGSLRSHSRSGFYKYNLEGLYRGSFYTSYCSFNQNTHIAKNFLALTKSSLEKESQHPNLKQPISIEEISIEPWSEFDFTSCKKEWIQKYIPNFTNLSQYIAICPSVGPNLAVRNYPPSYFSKLVQILLENQNQFVIFFGTKGDAAIAQEIISKVENGKNRCIDLCGKTSFPELLRGICGSEILITNDNGPAHFATLTGTKVLALFSTDSPFVYGPLGKCLILYSFFHCSPCISAFNHKTTPCTDNKCLQIMDPKKVAESAQLLLNDQANFRTINNTIPYLM